MMKSYTSYIDSGSDASLVITGPSDCVSESQAIQEAVDELLDNQPCIQTSDEDVKVSQTIIEDVTLPMVDMFLNPEKQGEKVRIVKEKMAVAKTYFNTSDMNKLYPELFKILWFSTLPCFQEEGMDEQMLLSCEIGGRKTNCSDIFTKVPSDSGMCCALNSADSLRSSGYKELLEEMQGSKATQTVESKPGKRNSLRITLDLHSNSVSFGTLDKEFDAFSMFIGQSTEFPVLKQRSLQLQPGHEHFVDLSATVISSNNIEDIQPEARGCLFPEEGSLEFYERYTFTNCMLECAILKAEERLHCIPWYLPQVKHINHIQPMFPRGRTHQPATPGQLESSPPCWRRRIPPCWRRRTAPGMETKSASIASQTASLPPTLPP